MTLHSTNLEITIPMHDFKASLIIVIYYGLQFKQRDVKILKKLYRKQFLHRHKAICSNPQA